MKKVWKILNLRLTQTFHQPHRLGKMNKMGNSEEVGFYFEWKDFSKLSLLL